MSETNGFIEPTNAMPNYPHQSDRRWADRSELHLLRAAPLHRAGPARRRPGAAGEHRRPDPVRHQPALYPARRDDEVQQGQRARRAQSRARASTSARVRTSTASTQTTTTARDSPNFVAESAADPTGPLHLDLRRPGDHAARARPDQRDRRDGHAVDDQARSRRCGAASASRAAAIAVINAATFQYGGGAINTPELHDPLAVGAGLHHRLQTFFTAAAPTLRTPTLGTHAYITNNNFFNNFDAAMQIEPNGLLAGNPLTPARQSGHPFFRGNVMQGNGIDGLSVVTDRVLLLNPTTNYQLHRPARGDLAPAATSNQTVNAVWDSTDLTYVLRGTIDPRGAVRLLRLQRSGSTRRPVPNLTSVHRRDPAVDLADDPGRAARHRAGQRRDDSEPRPVGHRQAAQRRHAQRRRRRHSGTTIGSTGIPAIQNAGAGFVVGVDDGVDPPASSPLVDPGAYSEIRILGIPGNQTTGQQRVPVIITSLRDDTVGTTVRGVVMDNIWNSAPVLPASQLESGTTLDSHTPAAGDGGYIYIGGNSLTEYDPTNPLRRQHHRQRRHQLHDAGSRSRAAGSSIRST